MPKQRMLSRSSQLLQEDRGGTRQMEFCLWTPFPQHLQSCFSRAAAGRGSPQLLSQPCPTIGTPPLSRPRSGCCRDQETGRGGSDRGPSSPPCCLPTASASAPFPPHRGGNVPRKTSLGLRCSFPELGLCWPGGNFGFPAPAAARAEPGPCSPRAHGCSLREARQGPLCG